MATTPTPGLPKPKKRNITLSFDSEIIRKAKILAAKRNTSVTGLLSQQILELIDKDDSYERARTSAVAMLRSGFTFGKIEHMTREEIYDREAAREALLDGHLDEQSS